MKFRKNIKKIMPLVLCMVLLLRFLIPFTAWAADSSFVNSSGAIDYSSLHMGRAIHRSGFWAGTGEWEIGCLGTCQPSSFAQMNEQYIYSGSSSIATTFANYIVEFKKYYPDYRVTKFNEYFDIYVYIDNWTYDSENTSNPDVRTGTRSYYFICPKKTRLCTVTKDLNCKKIDAVGQSNSGATIPVFFKTQKDGCPVFCLSYMYETGKFATQPKDYCCSKSGAGYSGEVGGIGYWNKGYKKYGWTDDKIIGNGNGSLVIDSLSGGKRTCTLGFTNIPLCQYDDKFENVRDFIGGDDSMALNQDSAFVGDPSGSYTVGGNTPEAGEGCDSFGWTSFDCSLLPGKDGSGDNSKDVYIFSAKYSYDSFPKMVYSPENYQIVVQFTMRTVYRMRSSVIQEDSWSTNYMFYNLNDYKSGFSIRGDEIKFQPSIGSSGQTSTSGRIASLVYSNVLEYIVALRGVDIGELSSVDSCYIYADIRLRKVSSETEYSSDFKQYKWDFSTMKKTELSPKVTTTGNGEDKRVSSVVTNDDGKTVINITVNVTGGSGGNGGAGGDGGNGGNGGSGGNGGDGGDGGSGGSGGSGIGVDDDNSKSFWSILKGIVAFFKALLDGEDGLFPVIAAFFEFIPASFWTVVIGAIVIIAVIAIYRLLKKS